MRIAYLSNRFPSLVEPYVLAELQEFRRRNVEVVSCSVLRPNGETEANSISTFDVVYIQPLRFWRALRATWSLLTHFSKWRAHVRSVLVREDVPWTRRLRVISHTWLGMYLAAMLRGREVDHIHVHHGYFASWMAMTAAQILDTSYSLTLHGSDLLVHDNYLDLKLLHCKFCVTVSEFNRRFIRAHYPGIPDQKILVQRMGVECETAGSARKAALRPIFNLLAVGRLHAVKDHAFLIHACQRLKERGINLSCSIAGEGPERTPLQEMIKELGLRSEVRLLGQSSREQLSDLYNQADLVVLTSKSEGIPLVLMEAMAHGKPVLAPAITGIPELVIDGENGFLYPQGSLDAFVEKVETIRDTYSTLDGLREAARQQVIQNFNRKKNVAEFCDVFLHRLGYHPELSREDSLLQQIQLSI